MPAEGSTTATRKPAWKGFALGVIVTLLLVAVGLPTLSAWANLQRDELPIDPLQAPAELRITNHRNSTEFVLPSNYAGVEASSPPVQTEAGTRYQLTPGASIIFRSTPPAPHGSLSLRLGLSDKLSDDGSERRDITLANGPWQIDLLDTPDSTLRVRIESAPAPFPQD
jgi:hypothetical protein